MGESLTNTHTNMTKPIYQKLDLCDKDQITPIKATTLHQLKGDKVGDT